MRRNFFPEARLPTNYHSCLKQITNQHSDNKSDTIFVMFNLITDFDIIRET